MYWEDYQDRYRRDLQPTSGIRPEVYFCSPPAGRCVDPIFSEEEKLFTFLSSTDHGCFSSIPYEPWQTQEELRDLRGRGVHRHHYPAYPRQVVSTDPLLWVVFKPLKRESQEHKDITETVVCEAFDDGWGRSGDPDGTLLSMCDGKRRKRDGRGAQPPLRLRSTEIRCGVWYNKTPSAIPKISIVVSASPSQRCPCPR